MKNGALRITRLEVRSKLFVPGNRPELFAKAYAGEADSISFDLEDAVPAAQKESARAFLRDYLASEPDASKVCLVRVNALGSEFFAADLASLPLASVDVINLPKVDSREQILAAVLALEERERAEGVREAVGILANIETPRGLRLAYEIAAAHERVVGLQIGMLDLARSCGIAPGNRELLTQVRLEVRLAASEAGIAALDGAYANVKDAEGFRADTEQAKALGINGRSCIHPSQVAVVNAVFAPGEQELARAREIVQAAEDAERRGSGAFLLHGEMVDAPVVERARGLLSRAGIASPPAEEGK